MFSSRAPDYISCLQPEVRKTGAILNFETNTQQSLLIRNLQATIESRRDNCRDIREFISECAMMRVDESLEGAVALQSEATEGVEAAVAETERGEPSVSIELLLEAIEKERASLDALEAGVVTFQQLLDQRRRAIDQQEEILSQLAEYLSNERR